VFFNVASGKKSVGLRVSNPILHAAIIAACVAPVQLLAAELEPDSAAKQPTWIVTLGGSVEYGPRFPGADRYGFSAMPSFDIRRFGEPDENSAPDDNIDYSVVDLNGFELGPVLGFRDGRSQSDDGRLKGLDTINWDVDVGIFAQYWIVPNRFRLRTEVRQAISNGSGLVADFGADWFQPVSDKWILSAGPRVSFGNDAYMHRYFSVSPFEAARSGTLPSFDASAGLKSVGFVASASYALTPTWTFQVYDRFDRLVGDAADSPISAIGSANQNVIGVSLSKAFNISF